MTESSRPRPPGSRPDDDAAGSARQDAERPEPARPHEEREVATVPERPEPARPHEEREVATVPERPEPARSYDEREVAAVLERAAQLQRGEPGEEHAPSPKPGLTLDELEQIAAEAGIDPALVRRAAGDVASRAAAARSSSPLLGGPTQLRHERSLPGLLSEVELAAAAERIRRELGELGSLELSPGGLSWSSANGHRTVSLRPASGRTLVVVESRLPGSGAFGGVVGGVGGGLGGAAAAAAVALGGSPVLGGALFAGCFAGSFLLLRLGYRALGLREARTAERLLDVVAVELASR